MNLREFELRLKLAEKCDMATPSDGLEPRQTPKVAYFGRLIAYKYKLDITSQRKAQW